MIIRSAVFELGAVKPHQWPTDGLPEFAFIGRSNVGKSSLINRLLARKALARTSGRPGKTQEINFYRINERFRLVDLPGYGYAAVSKTDRARFLKMLETYLQERTPLCRVVQLVDLRHEPSKDDVAVQQWLFGQGKPLVVVGTKSDKVSKMKIQNAVSTIRKALGTPTQVIPTSSSTGAGVDSLWTLLESDLEVHAASLGMPTSGHNSGAHPTSEASNPVV